MHPKKEDKLTDGFISKWRDAPIEKRAERVKELMVVSKLAKLTTKQQLEARVLSQIAQVKGELVIDKKNQEN
jgi:hypothetical protein